MFGDRDVTSVYAEMILPLVSADRPLPAVNSFEVTLSARFEDYSDFGSTTKPKVGANWRPVPWFMLRSSYNEGFMAPSLAALYTSPRWTITAGAGDIDTYRNPYLNEGPYVMRTYFGGNADLEAQESEGSTFGFVFDVPGVDGLSLTADFWKIERTNLLGQRTTAQISESDTALLQAYTREQIAAGVPVNQVDVGSGSPDYKGDPDVERFALTPEDLAAFTAYNAANPSNPAAPAGRILSRNQPFLNLSTSDHQGIDFGVRYVMPTPVVGQARRELGLEPALAIDVRFGSRERRADDQRRSLRRRRSQVEEHEQCLLGQGQLERGTRHLSHRRDSRCGSHDHCPGLRRPRPPRLHRTVLHGRTHRVPLSCRPGDQLQPFRRLLVCEQLVEVARRHAGTALDRESHRRGAAAGVRRLRL